MTFCQPMFHNFSQSSTEQGDGAPDSLVEKFLAFHKDLKDQWKDHLPTAGSQARSLLTELGNKDFGVEPKSKPKMCNRFAGQELCGIYVPELFAGTARLTRSFKRKGFRSLAFDKTSKRS